MKVLLLAFLLVSCSSTKQAKKLCLANLAQVGEPVVITEKRSQIKQKGCTFLGDVSVESCQGEQASEYHQHLLRNHAGSKKGNRVYVQSWVPDSNGFIKGDVYFCKY